MEIKNWMFNWFGKNSHLNSEIFTQHTYDNFLEKGWIDSLKFISLVTDIENSFNIKFSNTDFEKEIFPTIDGLVSIIMNKKNE
jgi:acyl carrier protein